jgi:ParB family chromosome partitioning protein
MRAALSLKATNARAERAEERARVNALQAQIDELNAEMVATRAEADQALAEERERANRLNEQVEALSVEVVRTEKQAEAVVGRAERAEADRDAERARAETLRAELELRLADQGAAAEQARQRAQEAQEALSVAEAATDALRQDLADRRARGLVARLRAAWRGE